MQFIFNEDSNLYGYAGKDNANAFAFPSNVKQMGCMEDGIRIYVEDYVYTYLYQYAKSGGGKEKLAALAGRAMVVDGQEVIVISGAIQAKDTAMYRGVLSFTEKTWDYINSQMEIYFKGLSLVGWVHTQPGFGAFMIAQDETFHKERFPKSHQVLFVIDPVEKADAFFIHNQEKTGLRAAKGYFVYYEKNKEMQDYMLDHNLGRQKISEMEQESYPLEEKQEEEGGFLEQETGSRRQAVERVTASRGEGLGERNTSVMVSAIRKEGITRRKPTQEERMDAAKDIRRVLEKRAKEADEQSRTKVNVLTGVSGVLCLTCLLMGSSLIDNIGRLKKLESEVASVRHSYIAMAQKIETDRAQVVFAAQNVPKEEETVKPPEPEKAETQPQEQPPSPPETKPESAPPVEQPAPVQTPDFVIMDSYIVEEGDTLGHISLVYYGSQSRIGDIMKVNNIDDANNIRIGQKLKIPE